MVITKKLAYTNDYVRSPAFSPNCDSSKTGANNGHNGNSHSGQVSVGRPINYDEAQPLSNGLSNRSIRSSNVCMLNDPVQTKIGRILSGAISSDNHILELSISICQSGDQEAAQRLLCSGRISCLQAMEYLAETITDPVLAQDVLLEKRAYRRLPKECLAHLRKIVGPVMA